MAKSATIRVDAPGKVILFGEHAVVHGKTAIAASVDLRTRLSIESTDQLSIILDLPDVRLFKEFDLMQLSSKSQELTKKQVLNKMPPEYIDEEMKAFAEEILAGTGNLSNEQYSAAFAFLLLFISIKQQSPRSLSHGIKVHAISELPVGAGLGSSASYSVCLAASLLYFFDMIDNVTEQENLILVNAWAFLAEKAIHGTPSGIDNTVSAFGGAIAYTRSQPMQPIDSFTKLDFLLTNTRVPRDTKTQVANVTSLVTSFPSIANPLLDSIQAISNAFKKSISTSSLNFDDLKKLININHHLLNALGVGHEALDKVCALTAKHGIASKLTGAGGGGCTLSLIHPGVQQETIEIVMAELKKEGFQCFRVAIGGTGVVLHDQ